MNVKIGTGPDAWGVWFPTSPKQIPWHRYLDEVAQAGYDFTELGPFGYLPIDPTELRAELESRNLRVCGGELMANLEDPSKWATLERQVLEAGELLAAVTGRFLVLLDDVYCDLITGRRIGPERLDESAWKRMIETVHRVADIAQTRFNLELVFHPHAETHVEYEDQIEAFLAETDPDRIGLCLDTGHHAYRGGDPVRFMRRHHRRIPYLHLKSLDLEKQEKVEREKLPFVRATELDVFCEPSVGAVDFLAFRDVLQEIDYEGFAIAEQDMYCPPFDKPLPIARRTRDYLRTIGIG